MGSLCATQGRFEQGTLSLVLQPALPAQRHRATAAVPGMDQGRPRKIKPSGSPGRCWPSAARVLGYAPGHGWPSVPYRHDHGILMACNGGAT